MNLDFLCYLPEIIYMRSDLVAAKDFYNRHDCYTSYFFDVYSVDLVYRFTELGLDNWLIFFEPSYDISLTLEKKIERRWVFELDNLRIEQLIYEIDLALARWNNR